MELNFILNHLISFITHNFGSIHSKYRNANDIKQFSTKKNTTTNDSSNNFVYAHF